MRYHLTVTLEARIGFVLLFFLIWIVLGFIPWAAAAVITRGRSALIALPLALAGAAAGGVLVPLAGLTDVLGFFLSMPAALLGSALASTAVILGRNRLSHATSASPDQPTGTDDSDTSHPGHEPRAELRGD
jgi:hypothetical protein